MKTFILGLLLLFSISALAREAPRMADDQLPPLHRALKRDFSKWLVHDEVFGDLNGDGIKDAAVIIVLEPKDPESDGDAAVAVLFGVDKAGQEFKLFAQSGGATCINCGGAKGAMDGSPLGQLAISDKGILTINYLGGSRWMFDITNKWRYDKNYNRLVLIGTTNKVIDTMSENGEEEEILDINYATLKAEKRTKKGKTTCDVPKELKDQEISGFDYLESFQTNMATVETLCEDNP
jgi:hypothetical protein